MRGSGFCYFHARPQRPAHPNEGRPKEARLDLPALLDPKGTQTAISRIISALAAKAGWSWVPALVLVAASTATVLAFIVNRYASSRMEDGKLETSDVPLH